MLLIFLTLLFAPHGCLYLLSFAASFAWIIWDLWRIALIGVPFVNYHTSPNLSAARRVSDRSNLTIYYLLYNNRLLHIWRCYFDKPLIGNLVLRWSLLLCVLFVLLLKFRPDCSHHLSHALKLFYSEPCELSHTSVSMGSEPCELSHASVPFRRSVREDVRTVPEWQTLWQTVVFAPDGCRPWGSQSVFQATMANDRMIFNVV